MWQQLKSWLKSQTIDSEVIEDLQRSNHYLRDTIKVLEYKLALKEKEYDNLLSAYVNLKVQLDLLNKSHDLSNPEISTQTGECREPSKLDIS
jgi:hypothetical protein